MNGKIGDVIVRHLFEGCDHFTILINTYGIKMTVRAFHNKLADGQGYHIRFGYSQLCDI